MYKVNNFLCLQKSNFAMLRNHKLEYVVPQKSLLIGWGWGDFFKTSSQQILNVTPNIT